MTTITVTEEVSIITFANIPYDSESSFICSVFSAAARENVVIDMISKAPSKNIMNKLARSVLALYSFDDNPDDISLPNVLRQSMNLMGYFPAIICYAYQAKSSYYDKKSLHLHDPIRELSTSENILRMLRPMGEYSDLELYDAPDFVHWHRYVFGDRGCGRFAQRPKTRRREHRGDQYDQ